MTPTRGGGGGGGQLTYFLGGYVCRMTQNCYPLPEQNFIRKTYKRGKVFLKQDAKFRAKFIIYNFFALKVSRINIYVSFYPDLGKFNL